MQRDGWWWSEPLLTNKSIRSRVFKEMLQARWVSPDRSAIGSMSSPRSK